MITKRQLGAGIAGLALIALLLTLTSDLLGAGNFQGIGPLQQITLIGSALLLVVGLSLIPLRDRPA